jgi:hypothetical protein
MSRERYALTAEDRDIAFFAAVQRALADRVTNTSDRAQSHGDVALESLKTRLAMITTGRPNAATRAHALRLQIARLEAQEEYVDLERYAIAYTRAFSAASAGARAGIAWHFQAPH